MWRRRRWLASAVLLLACVPRATVGPADASSWVGAWEAAPQLTEQRNLPPAPGLTGSTLRQVIQVSLGGSRWRFRVSNEFGDAPLVIESARVARTIRRDTIDAASDTPLSVRGASGFTIPAGEAAVSDDVAIHAAPLSQLTITLSIRTAPTAVTGHPGSRTTSYLVPGNHVADASLRGAVPVEHWYLISGVEVRASSRAGAVVVLGNSIADGRGSGTDRNNRWPDNLAARLRSSAATSDIAVLNAGIGGNAVLRGGLGPTALARLDRDVLAQPGARWLILSEGVNDIGGSAPDSAASVARQLIEAYQQIIRRARARAFRVYGATILPFAGSQYGSPQHESARTTVNAWIRESGAFDAVIDFDAALRNPADPTRLRAEADGGDHLHPNEQGYRMMADAIDLSLFSNRP